MAEGMNGKTSIHLHATYSETRQVKIQTSWYEVEYDCFIEQDAALACRKKECENPIEQQLLIKRVTRITKISPLEDPSKDLSDASETYKEALYQILAQAHRDQVKALDDVLCTDCRRKRLAEHPLGAYLAQR